jgi:hypothetical protein
MIADLATLIRRGLHERPPLGASYFQSVGTEHVIGH